MKPSPIGALAALVLPMLVPAVHGASLSPGYSIGAGSQLLTANGGTGAVLFNDSAALGGVDVTGTGSSFYSVLLDGSGQWALGDTISITGVALALVDSATNNGTFTFDIRQGAGGTGTSGTGGLTSLGTATASYVSGNGTSTYYVNFDSSVTFVADANSTSIVVNWTSTAQMRWKKENTPGAGRLPQVNYGNGNFVDNTPAGVDSVRISIAGSVTPVPESSVALLGALGCLALLRRRR